ncbi:MAG: 5-keto-4-deoxy-D-glucarate aldolase [Alphaproteobacteria bacterium MarineAlpha11_Bin1]|nr:MAG: 5-keto-4-deoxy-D-glucarate aldolase [Alphaproteobacteria bacterium MarineAlpha11_Bin1]|tara:strand:+ start:417 stop:1172 length:756 start_codon:yes stop_codon:yes gene_type:complete
MKNDLKTKIASKKACIGGWLTVRSPEVTDALASVGFDWIALDMEHGSFSVGDAENAFMVCERHGCAPLVRLPQADPILARRLLDSGAHGFLVPYTEDAGRFAEFASHCLFPPAGKRGLSLERFNAWGDNFDETLRDFAPVLVPMIESRVGVKNASAIASLDFVDALFFGPYDLSADLGTPGDFTAKTFLEARATVKEAARQHGKAAGGHQVVTDPKSLAQMVEDSFTFIAYGTDMIALRAALKPGAKINAS